jgi:hypothetical protein
MLRNVQPWRSGVAVLAATAVLVPTSACGDRNSEKDNNAGPPAITHEEATQEYFDEAARWELPPGWGWPEGIVYTGEAPDGAGVVYEPNTGRVDATLYWFCAWSRTLLGADSEADRATALGQVLRLPETPFYKVGLLPDGRASFDGKLGAAEAGDFRELTEITEVNCPEEPQ